MKSDKSVFDRSDVKSTKLTSSNSAQQTPTAHAVQTAQKGLSHLIRRVCSHAHTGRGVVVCEAFRDEGVAPTGECLLFVGAPPSGRWVVVCEAYRGGGAAPTGECPACCGRWVVVCEAYRGGGAAPTKIRSCEFNELNELNSQMN